MPKQRKRGNPAWVKGGPSPNPAGRPVRTDSADAAMMPAIAVPRNDGFVSMLTGLGTTRDKRQSAWFEVSPLTDVELRALYRGNDLAKRAVDTVPNEEYREGFEFKAPDPELVERVDEDAKRLRVRARFKKAEKFARAYGGAYIWPIINDGNADLTQPLAVDKITRITRLRVLEPREMVPDTTSIDSDLNSETHGEPLLFEFRPAGRSSSGQRIHRSRLIVFEGERVSNDPFENQLAPFLGDSVLLPMHEVLRDFGVSWSGAAALLVDFAQGVYTMDSLAEMLAKKQDDLVLKRLQTMDLAKSIFKAIVIDGKDKYERQQTPLTNLPELLDRLASRLAAAARLPVTVLMGQSPKGLGNEGDSDVQFLYDQIASAQDDALPLLEIMYTLILKQKDGPAKGKPPEQWSVCFRSLWQMTDKETAELRKQHAETDAVYLDRGVLTADEVRGARFGGDAYSNDLQIDVDADAEDDVDPKVAAEMAGDLRTPQAPGAAPTAVTPAETAMNGTQVSSMLEVIEKYNTKAISKKQGEAVMRRAFLIKDQGILNDFFDESFEAEKPEPPQPPNAPPPGAPPVPPKPPATPPPATDEPAQKAA